MWHKGIDGGVAGQRPHAVELGIPPSGGGLRVLEIWPFALGLRLIAGRQDGALYGRPDAGETRREACRYHIFERALRKSLYSGLNPGLWFKSEQRNRRLTTTFMRKTFSLLAVVALGALMATGCANTERKFGRGMANLVEPLRLGEMRRTMEQTALFDGPDVSYTAGFIRGLNRTLARTGIGVYEVVTAPIPPYDPVCTDYLSPNPVYPDNYTPTLVEDTSFSTDTNLGFGGGDVIPFVAGSRFRIFDTH